MITYLRKNGYPLWVARVADGSTWPYQIVTISSKGKVVPYAKLPGRYKAGPSAAGDLKYYAMRHGLKRLVTGERGRLEGEKIK